MKRNQEFTNNETDNTMAMSHESPSKTESQRRKRRRTLMESLRGLSVRKDTSLTQPMDEDDDDMREAWNASGLQQIILDEDDDDEDEQEMMSDLEQEQRAMAHQLVMGEHKGRTNLVQGRLEQMIRESRRQAMRGSARSMDGGKPFVDNRDFDAEQPKRGSTRWNASWDGSLDATSVCMEH